MTDGLLGILRHELLQVGFGRFMLRVGGAGLPEDGCEFAPAVGGAHIDDADRFQPRSRGLDPEQARRIAALDAAPEFLFRRDRRC